MYRAIWGEKNAEENKWRLWGRLPYMDGLERMS
jgi:hypothetical protein